MHETNKIELKLIEVDARSYLGLLRVTKYLNGFHLLSGVRRVSIIAF